MEENGQLCINEDFTDSPKRTAQESWVQVGPFGYHGVLQLQGDNGKRTCVGEYAATRPYGRSKAAARYMHVLSKAAVTEETSPARVLVVTVNIQGSGASAKQSWVQRLLSEYGPTWVALQEAGPTDWTGVVASLGYVAVHGKYFGVGQRLALLAQWSFKGRLEVDRDTCEELYVTVKYVDGQRAVQLLITHACPRAGQLAHAKLVRGQCQQAAAAGCPTIAMGDYNSDVAVHKTGIAEFRKCA